MDEFDMTAFGEFTKGRHGEPMAMLPTLPLEKNNWTFRQSCQKVPWATCYFEPLLATLPEALCRISFISLWNEAKEVIPYPLILPFSPTTFLAQSFCAVFQLLGGSHIMLWSWPALPKLYQIGRSFSFQFRVTPDDILESKRRITIWSGPSQKMSRVGVHIVILQI